MPSNLLAIDANFPTFTGEKKTEDVLRNLTNYLYQLKESLQYSLQNLTAENFNAAALENLSESQKTEISKQLAQVYKELEQVQGELRQLAARLPESEGMQKELEQLQKTVTGEGGLSDRVKALEEDDTLGQLQETVTGPGGLSERVKALEEDDTLGQLQETVTGPGGLSERVKALEEDDSLAKLQEAVTGEGGLSEQVADLAEDMTGVCTVVKPAEGGGAATLGEAGKDLYLVGNIYINGILFEQGGTE